jgi:hypothetical protein
MERNSIFLSLFRTPLLLALGLMCVSRFRAGRWSTPEALPFSGKYLDYPPKFDPTGKGMVFASSRPLPDGTRGGQMSG